MVHACANLSAYPIIVVDLSDEKLEFARKFGATIGINASSEDPVARVRELLVRWFNEGKMPLEVMVTRRYSLEQINEACDALARGEIAGRAIVVF